jgi:hypothetical protein
MEAVNGGTMLFIIVYKNFKWKIQGKNFITNIFIVELNSYDG